jgi:peptidoglycan/LPS O-acetylase OafA/YrhL
MTKQKSLVVPPAKTGKSERYEALDSLRGIAALVVVLFHCYVALPELPASLHWAYYTPLRDLVNGRAAVVVFFTLSGFVLALPFYRHNRLSYPLYLIRRFCRIYIPFAVAIVLAVGLYALTGKHPLPDYSYWLNSQWPEVWPGGRVLAAHFLMEGTLNHMIFDEVMWSLVHEMRISIFFPLLVLLCAGTVRGLAVAIICYIAGTWMLMSSDKPVVGLVAPEDFILTLAVTVRYATFFLFGILLCKHADAMRRLIGYVPRKIQPWLAILLLPLFMDLQRIPLPVTDVLSGIGAIAAIVLALAVHEVKRFLEFGLWKWLGRISYSLYLIHLPILLTLFYALAGRLPYLAICGLVIIASLVASEIMYRLVEAPAINLGHRLSGRRKKETGGKPEIWAA